MDKSWILKDRRSKDYEDGVEQFLNFAVIHASSLQSIRCPCTVCGNLKNQEVNEIINHLFFHGIDKSYRTWIWHGEPITDRASEFVNAGDVFHEQVDTSPMHDAAEVVEMVEAAYKHCTADPDEFKKLLEDAEKPLYPGCSKHSKLSALVRMFKFKARHRLSDLGFSNLLEMVAAFLPANNEVPLAMYEAEKTMVALGMGYEKIHACPFDYILYRKEFKDATSCPTCQTSRWKLKENSKDVRNGVPAKVLWYFPPIPRFLRMFQSAQTAKDLTWYVDQSNSDGQLRHPSDSPSWKLVDHKWPDFAAEPRNLRLAISADGINPYRSLSSKHSCWPVIMVTYNLPPWLCFKRRFMMLTLLISGPQQPGNDIDVYLAPLIDDLKMLWEVGVDAFDAYQQQHFKLKAILLWTINDFPAYGNLSGSKVKGYYACPICSEGTCSHRLKHGNKNVYMGHRKFLPRHHPYRKQKKAFNGEQEFGTAPAPLDGEQVFAKVEGLKIVWGKKNKRKSSDTGIKCWSKKSIFFDLEYWKFLHVRHNLDIMHIEKNICDSILGTLLNIPEKTKDGINSRLDIVEMGLRKELAPKVGEKRTYLPPACYTLSKAEKERVCTTLSKLKVPEGYSSNFRSRVLMGDLKIHGLKSHDCHVLMQQLLPLAIRSVLPKEVRYAITRLCFFFNALCSKVVDIQKLYKIQSELVVTLCLLEKYFPPSFFDIMVHLSVHLVREVRLCAPIFFRYMYQFERYMGILKGYVRNRRFPEGCIAENYIIKEAIEFCTEYLSGIDPIGLPVSKYMNSDDTEIERPLSNGHVIAIDREEWEQAHRYVLENTSDVQPYIKEHMDWLKVQNPRQSKSQKSLQIEHNKSFIYWLREKVTEELTVGQDMSNKLQWIAQGPRFDVIKHSGYIIKGCRYHTKDSDDSRVNQNSGVSLVATAMQVTGYKDQNPVYADMTFYGVITEIWQLDYHMFYIPIFKCDWVDNKKGIKVDELGFTLVELGRIGHKSDSFILASQAKQVFYVEDQLDPRWSIVIEPPQHRHPFQGDHEINDTKQQGIDQVLPEVEPLDATDDSMLPCTRRGVEGTWVDNGIPASAPTTEMVDN